MRRLGGAFGFRQGKAGHRGGYNRICSCVPCCKCVGDVLDVVRIRGRASIDDFLSSKNRHPFIANKLSIDAPSCAESIWRSGEWGNL